MKKIFLLLSFYGIALYSTTKKPDIISLIENFNPPVSDEARSALEEFKQQFGYHAYKMIKDKKELEANLKTALENTDLLNKKNEELNKKNQELNREIISLNRRIDRLGEKNSYYKGYEDGEKNGKKEVFNWLNAVIESKRKSLL